MAKGNGDWAKARQYLESHPNADSAEIIANSGIKNKNAAYQVLAASRKKGTTAGAALGKFKATRANLKRKGVIAGGDPTKVPFQMEVVVDDRGVDVVLHNCTHRIGTLELTPAGLVFVRGKAARSTERPIPWDLVAGLQGFASGVR